MAKQEIIQNTESDTKDFKEVSLVLEEINRQAEEASPEERAAIVAKAEAFEGQLDILEGEMGISREEADDILLRVQKGEFDIAALMEKYKTQLEGATDKATILERIRKSTSRPFGMLLLFCALSSGAANFSEARDLSGKDMAFALDPSLKNIKAAQMMININTKGLSQNSEIVWSGILAKAGGIKSGESLSDTFDRALGNGAKVNPGQMNELIKEIKSIGFVIASK